MDDELRFDWRAIDHPRSVICPHCTVTVPLPKTEPWAVVDGVAAPLECLESLLCRSCRRRIYLYPVSDAQRTADEELDRERSEDDD